jgi:hypothetical protein
MLAEQFESLRARHFGTELDTPKPHIFAPEAATSVRSSSLFNAGLRDLSNACTASNSATSQR